MAADLCRILFPVDFSNQCVLAARHVKTWLIEAREQFGNAAEFLRQKGDVVSTISHITNQKAADLVVVGRTRPGTLGLGVQGRILEIDHAAHRPILSVW